MTSRAPVMELAEIPEPPTLKERNAVLFAETGRVVVTPASRVIFLVTGEPDVSAATGSSLAQPGAASIASARPATMEWNGFMSVSGSVRFGSVFSVEPGAAQWRKPGSLTALAIRPSSFHEFADFFEEGLPASSAGLHGEP